MVPSEFPTSRAYNNSTIFSLQNLNHAGTEMKIIDDVPMSAKNGNKVLCS